MRILIDEGLPAVSKSDWHGHEIFTVSEMGWSGKKDNELLGLMAGRFDLFVTLVSPNSEYLQQKIAIYHVLPASETEAPILRSVLPDNPQTLERIRNWLYDIPIEKLGLSQRAINRVKRTGIITIGDCVDFFERIKGGGNPGVMYRGFAEAMFDDVKPKLEAQGYWPLGKA